MKHVNKLVRDGIPDLIAAGGRTADYHVLSPAEFRANIVRNLDEFHEVFGTRPGDGLWLEQEERVRIW